jgi:hypothetical protein
MKHFIIILALFTHSILVGADDAAAAAAHEERTKKTEEQEATHTQNMALTRIKAAISSKNIEIIFKWLPTITDEFTIYSTFVDILDDLSPADFTGPQLNRLQQLALDYTKTFGQLPQDFELEKNLKKWGPYLLRIYPRKVEVDVKYAAQKPSAPSYPAPTIGRSPELVFLTSIEPMKSGAQRIQKFALPLNIARNPKIVGQLISTTLEHDEAAREIPLNIRPRILEGLVEIFRLGKTSKKDLFTRSFFDIVNRYTPAEQFEMIEAANYLGAYNVLEQLAYKYVANWHHHDLNREALKQLPREVLIALADAQYEFSAEYLIPYNLIGKDEKAVTFDYAILLNENIVGPIIGKMAKSRQKATPLPIREQDLEVVKRVFRTFYNYLKNHRDDTQHSLKEKAVLAIRDFADHLDPIDYADLLSALTELKAFVLRDALITNLVDKIASMAAHPDKDTAIVISSLASMTIVPYLQMADWERIISRFDHDKLNIARDLFINQLVYKHADSLSIQVLKHAGFSENLIKLITSKFKELMQKELPALSPEAAKKEKDGKAESAGRASPPPPATEVIPLERQSADQEQVQSPNSEAARKRK